MAILPFDCLIEKRNKRISQRILACQCKKAKKEYRLPVAGISCNVVSLQALIFAKRGEQ